MENIISVEYLQNCSYSQFKDFVYHFLETKEKPDKQFFKEILDKVNYVLSNENEQFRPRNKDNIPGGMIIPNEYDLNFIIPDLHARRDFFKSLLNWSSFENTSTFDLIENNIASILCLGDGVHGEGLLAKRWIKAYDEFFNGYKKHNSMDEEIADSFNLMIVIMSFKIRYKERFNFLKGNHENILNETGNGNYSFAKFANEGAMVLEYFKKFYGNEIIKSYAIFEKKLPLFVKGTHFLASHSEPAFFFDTERVINYVHDSELIESLTWTDNFVSHKGTVEKLIEEFSPGDSTVVYFGGHRPVKHLYNRINNNNYIQIHNPYKWVCALVYKGISFNPDEHIVEIPQDKTMVLEPVTELVAQESELDFTEYFKD